MVEVMEVIDATKVSDICMVLVPDELQADYKEHLEKEFKKRFFFITFRTWSSYTLSIN